jgi:putative NADH-flavin reductase
MNIFIAGANGGIGRQVVQQALDGGHRVTALVRDPSKLAITHPSLLIVRGDVLAPNSFSDALRGQDLVVSALGLKKSGGEPVTLYSQGCANLFEAMDKQKITRFFCISASALDINPLFPWYLKFVTKYILQRLLKEMYADLRRMEAQVKGSKSDWTIIRPPRLTNGPLTGHYRIAVGTFLKNCLKISRADVGHYILHHVQDTASFRETVEIGY